MVVVQVFSSNSYRLSVQFSKWNAPAMEPNSFYFQNIERILWNGCIHIQYTHDSNNF